MNFDDIKSNWNNINKPSEKSRLTSQEIESIIKIKNKSNHIKSSIPEILIILTNLYLIIFLLIFNDKYDSQFLKALSFLSIIVLICQSGLIYSTIRIFNNKLKLSATYHRTIQEVENECKKLSQHYYTILGLGLVILFSSIILLPKIYSEDLTIKQILITYSVSIILFGYLSFRIYKYYKQLILNNNYFKMNLYQDEDS